MRARRPAFRSVIAEKKVFLMFAAIVVMSASMSGWSQFPKSLTGSSETDWEPSLNLSSPCVGAILLGVPWPERDFVLNISCMLWMVDGWCEHVPGKCRTSLLILGKGGSQHVSWKAAGLPELWTQAAISAVRQSTHPKSATNLLCTGRGCLFHQDKAYLLNSSVATDYWKSPDWLKGSHITRLNKKCLP